MTLCYIFMKIRAGFIENVINRLNDMPEVKEAHAVTGATDIIAKVEGKDFPTISKVILSKIHNIDGVERTSTHLVAEL
jgi:DNA-binding Lrp family transcriptional regulator